MVAKELKFVRLVLCLPGNNFSGRFLECMLDLTALCYSQGIRLIVSRKESCNIYYVRNMCLGGDVLRGALQQPFNGTLDYDYLLWIHSDVIFNPRQVIALLQHDVDIVAGLYLMADGQHFAACRTWDETFFRANGYFPFLTPKDIDGANELIEVSYTGFGFIVIKKGVFESLEYPWFQPVMQKIGDAVDFTMEDVGFCLRASEKGFKVCIDPQIRVGHEKRVIL